MAVLRTHIRELTAELDTLRGQLDQERRRHARAIDQARLDAALKTARRVTHELRNVLSPVAGYGELLARRVTGEDAILADRCKQGALRAADFLNRLDEIRVYRESEYGGETMLDLDAAAGRGN